MPEHLNNRTDEALLPKEEILLLNRINDGTLMTTVASPAINLSKFSDEIKLKNSIRKREIKLVKTLCLNVFFYCVAWLPYAFVTMYAQYGPNMVYYITPWSTSIPAIMAKLSSVYNPIIYVMTSKDCKNYIQARFSKPSSFKEK